MQNPFKMLGDINAMRKQAMAIQQALEKEQFEVTEGNTRVLISGNQDIKEITIDGIPNETVRRAVNSAIKKSQQAAAGKLAQMSGGFGGQQES